jgi:2-dehydropantoate 2-reductase
MSKNNPHIAILGAGSIGCFLGGCLMAEGSSVTLVGRPRIQQQLSEHGLHVTDWQGRDTNISSEKVSFLLSTEVLKEADYILVTVKSGDTEAAAQSIASEANPNSIIISFQNGIRNAEILQQYLPNNEVLKGMVPFNVISNGNGHFHCGTEGNLAIEDKRKVATTLVHTLQQAKLPVTVYDDILGVQWGKLLMNLSNSVNALSGIPLLEQLNNKTYRKVMASSSKEALRILKAANITPARNGKVIPSLTPYILSLPTWLFKRIANAMLKIDPEARSSMYEDLHLGRRTEIDYLNGEIVALAKSLGLSAPINLAIVKLVKQAEENNLGSPMIQADTLKQQTSNAS